MAKSRKVKMKSASAKRAVARLKKLYGSTGKASEKRLKGLRAVQAQGGSARARKARRAIGHASAKTVRAAQSLSRFAKTLGGSRKTVKNRIKRSLSAAGLTTGKRLKKDTIKFYASSSGKPYLGAALGRNSGLRRGRRLKSSRKSNDSK